MSYTPNQELERLKKEKEENEKKVEQLDHRIQRLENRIKYYKDVDRKKRTHRLCTVAGTLESIAPAIKELEITEVMELLEYIFHMEDVKNAVNRMTASCYRFVILSVFTSNPSVPSAKSAGFCKVLSIASTRVRAHLGHNLGQGSWVDLERFCRGGCGL